MMEDAIRKQGPAFIQQQRFGKRWRRVWCVLFRDSSCSISRLEFFDCKESETGTQEKSNKALRKQQDSKKVIRLSDCIRVSTVDVDGCPRDTGAFLVETTGKLYVFAVDTHNLRDWTHVLCETAFPTKSMQRRVMPEEEEGMEDNSLYSGREMVHDFRVCVRWTEAAERCGLAGVCVLRTDVDCLHLLDSTTHQLLFTWPYHLLRRFGRDKTSFSFEAGRRCDSGEGTFEFDTRQGNTLFQVLDIAIRAHCGVPPQRQNTGGGQNSPESPHPRSQHVPQPPDQCHLKPPVDKVLTGVKSLTLETHELAIPRKNQVKTILSCPLPSRSPDPSPTPNSNPTPNATLNPDPEPTYAQVGISSSKKKKREKREKSREGGGGSPCPPTLLLQEPEYSLPFDCLSTNLMVDILSKGLSRGGGGADPLYDSIDESQIAALQGMAEPSRIAFGNVDHIYDEPECCVAIGQMPPPPVSMYDYPEELRGNAWKIMGTDIDSKGHQCPYNSEMDDYDVPRLTQRAEGEEEEEEEQYNNVTIKVAEREKR